MTLNCRSIRGPNAEHVPLAPVGSIVSAELDFYPRAWRSDRVPRCDSFLVVESSWDFGAGGFTYAERASGIIISPIIGPFFIMIRASHSCYRVELQRAAFIDCHPV